MSQRMLSFDRATLKRVVHEDDESIVFESVIAREIVHEYREGWAYKPADELEKSAKWLSRCGMRPLTTGQHPDSGFLERGIDVKGRIENNKFVKNLVDPKTKRPMDRGIKSHLRFYKDLVPSATVESMRNGDLSDVSIGFTWQMDKTAGEWRGQKYDFVQRNIFIDHVVGALEAGMGRCPSPYCGISVDSIIRIGGDPWEETEETIRSGHRSTESFSPNSMRTIEITEGVKAVVGCPKGKYEGGKCTVGMEVQSYIFDKSKFTMSEAKAWFNEHEGKDAMAGIDMMSTIEIEEKLAELRVEKRLLQDKINTFYKDRYTAPPEIQAASARIENIDIELRAFEQAKIRKIVGFAGGDQEEGEREKTREQAETRCGKYPVSLKEEGHLTKPGEYVNIEERMFGDPCNFKYPMTEQYVMAAWAYVSKPENRSKGGYSEAEWTWIQNRIKKRMEAEGHEITEEGDVKKIPCFICDAIEQLGKYGFAKRLITAFGKDMVMKMVNQETYQEFMEKCLAEEGMDMEKCVARWKEQHPESTDQDRVCENCENWTADETGEEGQCSVKEVKTKKIDTCDDFKEKEAAPAEEPTTADLLAETDEVLEIRKRLF